MGKDKEVLAEEDRECFQSVICVSGFRCRSDASNNVSAASAENAIERERMGKEKRWKGEEEREDE